MWRPQPHQYDSRKQMRRNQNRIVPTRRKQGKKKGIWRDSTFAQPLQNVGGKNRQHFDMGFKIKLKFSKHFLANLLEQKTCILVRASKWTLSFQGTCWWILKDKNSKSFTSKLTNEIFRGNRHNECKAKNLSLIHRSVFIWAKWLVLLDQQAKSLVSCKNKMAGFLD